MIDPKEHEACRAKQYGGCVHGLSLVCPNRYRKPGSGPRKGDPGTSSTPVSHLGPPPTGPAPGSPQKTEMDDPANWNLPYPDSFVRMAVGDGAAKVGRRLVESSSLDEQRQQNRVAVTVFMEVEGQWIDPENVAVEIVKQMISRDPRGMSRPVRVEVPRSPGSEEMLGAVIYTVQDAQEALGYFTITPMTRPYR